MSKTQTANGMPAPIAFFIGVGAGLIAGGAAIDLFKVAPRDTAQFSLVILLGVLLYVLGWRNGRG